MVNVKKKHIAKRQKHILKTEILNLQEAFHQLPSDLPKLEVVMKWLFRSGFFIIKVKAILTINTKKCQILEPQWPALNVLHSIFTAIPLDAKICQIRSRLLYSPFKPANKLNECACCKETWERNVHAMNSLKVSSLMFLSLLPWFNVRVVRSGENSTKHKPQDLGWL